MDPSLKQIVAKSLIVCGSCPEHLDSHDLDLKPGGTMLLVEHHCGFLGLCRPWTLLQKDPS